jgi:hypothetical protein
VVAVAFAALSAISAVRAGVPAGLYRAELTELLALAKLALGWPLTALAVVVTVAAVRRATPAAHPGSPHGRTQPLKAEARTAATRAP